ncbi:MAG: AI-2E family transporter [Nanoarchaeota archaeon]|nr:AI-2E family transporter [Nanoarchaeota archaeon]
MFDEKSLKQLVSIVLIAGLLILAFLVIKPIAMSIIFGLVLAYICYPLYKLLLKVFKNQIVTASVTCAFFFILFFLTIWFLVPLLANQIFDSYSTIQSWDVVGTMKTFFPFLFTNDQISANIIAAYGSFLSNTLSTLLHSVTDILVELPTVLLQFLVVLIVFFYALKDGDKILELIRESLPFNRRITNKFIKKSSEVTFSVVFGRVVIGIIVGLFTGAMFLLLGVPNSFFLTFIAIIAAIIPIIGPWLVWIPVMIGLFVTGRTTEGVILLIYGGLFISFIDNILHAWIVAKRAHVSTALTLIGLIGGIFLFGIFGIILGPLIAAYLEALFEIYREYNVKSLQPK